MSELLDAVAAKMGGAPDDLGRGYYVYQFDGGSRVPAQGSTDCYNFADTWDEPNTLQLINPEGTCDAVYEVSVSYGISEEHARGVSFALYDNERAKANLAADYEFFNRYVERVRNSTGGATPSL